MSQAIYFKYNGLQLSLHEGDLTKHAADIIVNSANEILLGEDGVDGAIHIAAGPELQAECDRTGFCAVTDVVITDAYRLPAKHVFHTVGPQWNGDVEAVDILLTLTYYNNLKKGEELRLRSIAFPSVSTGQYGVPTSLGAKSFTKAIRRFAKDSPEHLTDIRMVTYYDPDFDECSDMYKQYSKHLAKLSSSATLYNKFFNRGR